MASLNFEGRLNLLELVVRLARAALLKALHCGTIFRRKPAGRPAMRDPAGFSCRRLDASLALVFQRPALWKPSVGDLALPGSASANQDVASVTVASSFVSPFALVIT